MTRVLLSADDRTGSLEVGGLIANDKFSVPVGPDASSERCCVVDIASRHLSVAKAQARMEGLLTRPAQHRAHKMDAGLRGNWAHEVDVLLRGGYKVAIVCAFPDAGRRCKDGVVYIHDLPVLESVFGQDPLSAQISSKPAEVLEHFGVQGDVVVWDANDNAQMLEAVRRAIVEDRIVVGASGAIGTFAQQFLESGPSRRVALESPMVVLCGSLNPLSRQQISLLDVPIHPVGSDFSVSGLLTVVATVEPDGPIGDDQAREMAEFAASEVRRRWPDIRSLIVIGGDTAGALVGDDTLETLGCVAPGIPVSLYDDRLLVTKGGGIGQPETVAELCAALS